LSHLRRAIELDPLNLQYNSNLGQALCNARQYDACIDQVNKALEIDPNFSYAHGLLRLAYKDIGKYELSLEEWKKSASLANDKEELAIVEDVARVNRRSGYKASVEREIELRKQLSHRRYVDPVDVARAYAYLGDKEQAFAWLDKGLAEKSGGMEAVKTVRELDQWHSDPRYIELLKQLGLPR
jgi:tetratricopeptide (TPR) repeat protein